jgi:hypothetical protein
MFSRSKYSDISKLFCRTVDSHQLIFILDVDYINSISMCDKYLTRVTRRVPLLEKDLLILLVQMCSSPILSCFRTAESLVCMQFYNVRRPIFVFFPFSFGHFIVFPSVYYSSWLPLWYLSNWFVIQKHK